MPVFRLIYVSRVARSVRFSDVEAIAHSAIARNTANGLTGMLLYTPSHFIQVLEGEERLVNETVARIQQDKRHSELRVIDAREVDAREFDVWAMVARHVAGVSESELKHLTLERVLELLRSARAA